MHYRINVAGPSHDGARSIHWFATAPHSITCEAKARAMFAELCARFPAADGFNVSVSLIEETGTELDWAED